MSKFILLLNGPNLNLLGKREPHIYGHETLQDLEENCKAKGSKLGLEVICQQENSEGAMVDIIQAAMDQHEAIVINPGAYSHTSVAIRDALATCGLPVFEVHISNIHSRESFRHHSYVSGIAIGVICGMGLQGYEMALQGVASYLKVE